MIPSMGLKEVAEIAGIILTSLGGGTWIVFGLSSQLGKLWADRALAQQKQEYAQQNMALQSQFDLAIQRVQVGLQTLGHLQKLSTESAFNKTGELWKALVRLETAFRVLPRAENGPPL